MAIVSTSRTVKWGGAISLTALLTYLVVIGFASIQTSGDVECIENPCVSDINLTCQRSFSIKGAKGGMLTFSPEIERWELKDKKTGVLVNLANFSCRRGVKHEWQLYQHNFVTDDRPTRGRRVVVIAWKQCGRCGKSKLIHILL